MLSCPNHTCSHEVEKCLCLINQGNQANTIRFHYSSLLWPRKPPMPCNSNLQMPTKKHHPVNMRDLEEKGIPSLNHLILSKCQVGKDTLSITSNSFSCQRKRGWSPLNDCTIPWAILPWEETIVKFEKKNPDLHCRLQQYNMHLSRLTLHRDKRLVTLHCPHERSSVLEKWIIDCRRESEEVPSHMEKQGWVLYSILGCKTCKHHRVLSSIDLLTKHPWKQRDGMPQKEDLQTFLELGIIT